MTTEISAKIIADSVNHNGDRLTTMELEYPRFILAEFNTHRVFSRNTASSRAIPTAKLIERVREDPAMPAEWGSNQPGMQAGRPVNNPRAAQACWEFSAKTAANQAEDMAAMGVHKQIVNRLIEPFMWIKTIVSSTEWDNFFAQRISPLAQPEMRVLAERMRTALMASIPDEMGYGDWHAPYLDDFTSDDVEEDYEGDLRDLCRISVARCARVSYLTHDGKRDISKDLELYERLRRDGHWSPFEHVATPCRFFTSGGIPGRYYSGNFTGWAQLRHLTEYQ